MILLLEMEFEANFEVALEGLPACPERWFQVREGIIQGMVGKFGLWEHLEVQTACLVVSID